METVFTPWRYQYIVGPAPAAGECFLCAAWCQPEAPERLVVHRTDHHVVLLNKHPYSNGHVMIAPREHVATPRDSDSAAQRDLWPLVLRTERVVEETFRPHGLNIGLNLGRAAGAGVPDHFHVHVVPRWLADTNFMTSIGEVRLVPEDLTTTRERLRTAFAALAEEEALGFQHGSQHGQTATG
jgi:ATP adenylyltransferase